MDGESSRLQVQELDLRWSPHLCLLPACGLGQHRHDPSKPILGSSTSKWKVTTVPPLEVCCDDYKGVLVKPSSQCPAVSAQGKLVTVVTRAPQHAFIYQRVTSVTLMFQYVLFHLYTQHTVESLFQVPKTYTNKRMSKI